MKKLIMLGLLLSVSSLLNASTDSTKPVTTELVESTEDVLNNAINYGEEYLEDFFKEHEKSSPFRASSETGICTLGGVESQKYAFADCANLKGKELRVCCLLKDKKDVSGGKFINSLNTPDWMKNNSFFAAGNNFFAPSK